MDCKEVRKKLLNYLEGDVSLKDRKEIKKHLRVCRECNKEMENLRRLFEILDKETIPEPGDRFWRELPKRIDIKLNRRTKRLRKLMAIAASIIIIIGGLLVFRYTHKEGVSYPISESISPIDTLSDLIVGVKDKEEIEGIVFKEIAPKSLDMLESEEIEESDIEELIDDLNNKEKLLLCKELEKLKKGGR